MVHLNLICRLLYMNDYEAVFNFSSQIERFVQTLFCSTHQRIFIYKAPFLFVEVCRKPQPHGLLQWAAPAGVWRGAITAETQVTVSLLKRPPDPRESCKQRSFGHNQYQLKQDRCELAVRKVLTMSRAPASTWKAGCTCNPTLKTQKTPWGLLTRSSWLRTQRAGGQGNNWGRHQCWLWPLRIQLFLKMCWTGSCQWSSGKLQLVFPCPTSQLPSKLHETSY